MLVVKPVGIRWTKHVRVEEVRSAYRDLVGEPEGRRQLGKPTCRREDNIKMNFKEIGWGAWSGLIWLRIGKNCVLL
jgi:hypothetical protein